MVKLASTDPIHYQERPFQCFVHRLLIFLFKRSENEFRISMLVVTLPQRSEQKDRQNYFIDILLFQNDMVITVWIADLASKMNSSLQNRSCPIRVETADYLIFRSSGPKSHDLDRMTEIA